MANPYERTPGGPSAIGFIFGVLQADAVPGPVLIRLLGDLGMTEAATRTMLSRMVIARQMTRARHGRLAIYRLAGGFREQFLRVRVADEIPPWTGSFNTIVYGIPETLRADRDALRERAAQSGFGSVRPGLLIGLADPDRWIGEWSQRQDILVEAATLTCSLPTARRLAAAAWSLDDIAAEHQELLDWLQRLSSECSDSRPGPVQSFLLLNTVMRSFAGLYLVLPSIPDELTPPDWPGRSIPAALGSISELLGPPAVRHATELVEQLGLEHLVVPLDAAAVMINQS